MEESIAVAPFMTFAPTGIMLLVLLIYAAIGLMVVLVILACLKYLRSGKPPKRREQADWTESEQKDIESFEKMLRSKRDERPGRD